MPDYVLKFNDGRMVPKNESTIYIFLKGLFILCIIIIIMNIVIFKESGIRELSFYSIVGLFALGAFVFSKGGYERKECYTEIAFYEERMIVTVPEHYYNKNKINKEVFVMDYSDVKEGIYRPKLGKMDIFGPVDVTFYRYRKNGSLNEKPCYHRKYDGLIKFYNTFEPDIDFVREIEEHSPIKITVIEN